MQNELARRTSVAAEKAEKDSSKKDELAGGEKWVNTHTVWAESRPCLSLANVFRHGTGLL